MRAGCRPRREIRSAPTFLLGRLVIFAVGVVLVTGLLLLLRYPRVGLAMHAVAQMAPLRVRWYSELDNHKAGSSRVTVRFPIVA